MVETITTGTTAVIPKNIIPKSMAEGAVGEKKGHTIAPNETREGWCRASSVLTLYFLDLIRSSTKQTYVFET